MNSWYVKNIVGPFLVISCLLWAFGIAAADQSTASNPFEDWKDKKVSLNYKSAPFEVVLADLAGQIGRTPTKPPSQTNPITVCLTEVPAKDALSMIVNMADPNLGFGVTESYIIIGFRDW